ncbi:MAG: hypothetical protein EOP04_06740 [Proteobacteria bacterium]|nr:MAG: hypothetical protein EOP04_06740 [Pseudomonadota bacterium]
MLSGFVKEVGLGNENEASAACFSRTQLSASIIGYSYGSVKGAQEALGMANLGIRVDNEALVGSPISSDSALYKALFSNPNIRNVFRFDINGNKQHF